MELIGDSARFGQFRSDRRIWETSTGKELIVLQGHRGHVQSVAWSPRASRLATASSDGTIKIWDGETGTEIRSLVGHARGVNSVTWSPDGKRIVTASADRNLIIWDAEKSHAELTLRGHDDEVVSAAWSPDGRLIASGGRDGVIKIWDAATGMTRRSLQGEGMKSYALPGVLTANGWRLQEATARTAGSGTSNPGSRFISSWDTFMRSIVWTGVPMGRSF